MFTNFQRKEVMSRGGHSDRGRFERPGGGRSDRSRGGHFNRPRGGWNGPKRWSEDKEQYRGYNERNRYVKDDLFYQQESFSFQSDQDRRYSPARNFRHAADRRYNSDQGSRYAEFQHTQQRISPSPKGWKPNSNYESRQRSYHDNKENKNNPNYQKYASPKGENDHDRIRGKRERSCSPQRHRRDTRSKSKDSSHSRKKRRIKEGKQHSKSPSNRSDFSNEGKTFQNERRRHNGNDKQGDRSYKFIDHRTSRTQMKSNFYKKKQFFTNKNIYKNRNTWRKVFHKNHGNRNEVRLGKKLSIPPISNDEFSQRSEEAESDCDKEEGSCLDDLEEGEIDTDDENANKKIKGTKKQKRVKTESSGNKIERENKSDITDAIQAVTSGMCDKEQYQERLRKVSVEDLKSVRNDRLSYVEDTSNFFNRVNCDNTQSKGESENIENINNETILMTEYESNSNKENDSIFSELDHQRNREHISPNKEITELKEISNATNEPEVSMQHKIKSPNEEKGGSVEKLKETLRLTKSNIICGDEMIQKIGSLASKSFVNDICNTGSEMNVKDSRHALSAKKNEKVYDGSETLMEAEEDKIDTVCNNMEEPKEMRSDKRMETSECDETVKQIKTDCQISNILIGDTLELEALNTNESLQNISNDVRRKDEDRVKKTSCFDENALDIIGGNTEKDEFHEKDMKNIKPKIFTPTCKNQKQFYRNTIDNELKSNTTDPVKSKTEHRSDIVVERPITPPPYSSQSSKENEGYYFSNGPSFDFVSYENKNVSKVSDAFKTQQSNPKNQIESVTLGILGTESSPEKDRELCPRHPRYLELEKSKTIAKIDWKFASQNPVVNKSGFSRNDNSGFIDIQKLSLKNKTKPATYSVTSKNDLRKRHESEQSVPVTVKGRKNRPSDGIFISLGKQREEKCKIVNTATTQQQTVTRKENEQTDWKVNTDINNAKRVDFIHDKNSKIEKKESAPRKTISLFNKNKKRISHFANFESKCKKHKAVPKNSLIVSDRSNLEKCRSSKCQNIFEKNEKLSVSSSGKNGTGPTINEENTLISKPFESKISHKDNIEKSCERRGKTDSVDKEKKESKQYELKQTAVKVDKSKNMNGKQNKNKERIVKNNVYKLDIINAENDPEMLPNDKNGKYLTSLENGNEMNDDKNSEKINQMKILSEIEEIDQKEKVPSTSKENVTEYMEKHYQNCSDFKENDKGLQNQFKNGQIESDIRIYDNSVNKQGSIRSETGNNQNVESERDEEQSRCEEEAASKSKQKEILDKDLESDDDMNDIEPIEMFGSAFINEVNEDTTENCLIAQSDIRIDENDLKVDYCDDSIIFRSTSSHAISKITENIGKNKIKNKSNENSGFYNAKDRECKENLYQFEKAGYTENDTENNNETIGEEFPKKDKQKKSPSRCFRSITRKRFSATLETLGKTFDDQNVCESEEKILSINSNLSEETKLDKEKTENQLENVTFKKPIEWLELAKSNMKKLFKGNPKASGQTELSTHDENDADEEDLPSARKILQWDDRQPNNNGSEANGVSKLTSAIISSPSLSASIPTVSETVLNKTAHGTSRNGNQLTANTTVEGTYMSISSTVEENNTCATFHNQTIQDNVDPASVSSKNGPQPNAMTRTPHLNTKSSDAPTTDIRSGIDSCLQQMETSVSPACANVNLQSEDLTKENAQANMTSFTVSTIQKANPLLSDCPFQRETNQANQLILTSQSHNCEKFVKHAQKAIVNEQRSGDLQYKHLSAHVTSKKIVNNNHTKENSCLENGNRFSSAPSNKNGVARPLNIANVPMYSHLTAPLMGRNNADGIYQAPFSQTPTAPKNDSTTTPIVNNHPQSNGVDINTVPINNENTATSAVTAENYSLAFANVEMPVVQEQVRPNNSAKSKEPAARLSSKQTNAQNEQTRLLDELAKEERRRQLYRELCDLDKINTGDFGLDLLFLSKKSELRGLALVDKEILHLRQQEHTVSQVNTFQPNGGNINIAERIQYLRNTK